MPTTMRFIGQVSLYSTLDSFPGPKVQALEFQAIFDDGGAWNVTVPGFGEIVVHDIDAPTGKIKLVVTLTQDAAGSSSKATGDIALKARFNFKIAGVSSKLPLPFDTGTHTLPTGAKVDGKPVDVAHGVIALAGKGTFSGGFLNGKECAVLLEGRFDPNPWA